MDEKQSNEEKTDLADEFKRLLESGVVLDEKSQIDLLNRILSSK
ncbi:MAG: hypothetical protein WC451_00720 [Patescibacteria group bacterium]